MEMFLKYLCVIMIIALVPLVPYLIHKCFQAWRGKL